MFVGEQKSQRYFRKFPASRSNVVGRQILKKSLKKFIQRLGIKRVC